MKNGKFEVTDITYLLDGVKEGLTLADLTARANALLAAEMERWPVVRLAFTGLGDIIYVQRAENATHTARLACIEEIGK